MGRSSFISKKLNLRFHEHEEHYIILPMTMFKNFHIQFDIGNNLISFYSNDTSLLKAKKEEQKEEKKEERQEDRKKEQKEPIN